MAIKKKKGEIGNRIKPTEDKISGLEIDHPVFCFKYLKKGFHLDECTDDESTSLIRKLVLLSQLTWQEIQFSPKHGLGSEKISQDSIKAGIPSFVTPEEHFLAIRFDGKKPFVGVRRRFVFHVVYIDRSFILYNH